MPKFYITVDFVRANGDTDRMFYQNHGFSSEYPNAWLFESHSEAAKAAKRLVRMGCDSKPTINSTDEG